MSFVDQEDVFGVIEPVLAGLFREFADGREISDAVFPRIPYAEAIRTYGSDKPDLRNPLKMQSVTEHFAGSGFKVFAGMETVLADGFRQASRDMKIIKRNDAALVGVKQEDARIIPVFGHREDAARIAFQQFFCAKPAQGTTPSRCGRPASFPASGYGNCR